MEYRERKCKTGLWGDNQEHSQNSLAETKTPTAVGNHTPFLEISEKKNNQKSGLENT